MLVPFHMKIVIAKFQPISWIFRGGRMQAKIKNSVIILDRSILNKETHFFLYLLFKILFFTQCEPYDINMDVILL